MRHLPAGEVSATLRRGKPVEQFLGRSPIHPAYIRYVEMRPVSSTIEVWLSDVEDIGTSEHLDLYGFPQLDPNLAEEPDATFQDPRAAIAYAASSLQTDNARWVNQFVAQDEYLDYIQQGRPQVWQPGG